MSDVSSIGNVAVRLLAEATARSTLLALAVGLGVHGLPGVQRHHAARGLGGCLVPCSACPR